MLDVLLVAPVVPGLPPLSWMTEITSISAQQGVNLNFVGGETITKADIANVLRARHDIVLWAGHGRPGELLGPGWKVQPEWIAVQIRCGLPRLVILAACGSGITGRHMTALAAEVAHSGINTVAFLTNVDDRAALIYDQELIRAAAAGADMWSAHRVAVEAIRDDYPRTAKAATLIPGFTDGIRDFIVRIENLENGLNNLCTRVSDMGKSLDKLSQHFNL